MDLFQVMRTFLFCILNSTEGLIKYYKHVNR